MTQRIRAGAAAALLVLTTLAPPLLLLQVGRARALLELEWPDALMRPDDGRLLLGLVTLAAWLAWALWTASVLSELAGHLAGRTWRLPALGLLQTAASALVVATLASGPQAWASPPQPTPLTQVQRSAVSPAAEVAQDPASALNDAAAEGTGAGPVYTVAPGDDLWTIAENLLGDGLRWHDIAAANPRVQDPEHIEIGWELTIPGWQGASQEQEAPVVEAGKDPEAAAPQGTVASAVEDERTSAGAEERADAEDSDEAPGSDDGQAKSSPEAPETASPIANASTAPAGSTAEPESARDEAGPSTAEASAPLSPADENEAEGSVPVSPVVEEKAEATASPVVEDEADAVALDAVAGPLAGLAGFSAAAIVGGVAMHRRRQQLQRDVGRRISPAPVPAQRLESVLGRLEDAQAPDVVETAQRAIAAHCRGTELPHLMLATLSPSELRLELDAPASPPPGFRAEDNTWVLRRRDAALLPGVHGPLAYPGLIAVGESDEGTVLVDLEEAGVLGVRAPDAAASIAALLVAAAAAPWSDEIELVATREFADVVAGSADVQLVDDAADAVALPPPPVARRAERLEPDSAAELAPRLAFVAEGLARFEPAAGVGAVVPADGGDWLLDVEAGRLETPTRIVPLRAPSLDGERRSDFADLVAAATTTLTEPAPWWAPDADGVAVLDPADAPTPAPRPWETTVLDPPSRTPELLLLGPIDLVGCAGDPPPRAVRQCMEYVAWLLENPGSTASQMASALIVAEGTRRSNLSRLRSWLGKSEDGEPYLPDGYTGRLELHPLVTSDWAQFQVLVAPGVNRCRLDTLTTALSLVRGAPLADAAPSQWHWAEPMRSDMVSLIRDVGVRAAELAWATRDVDYVRWATARALAAAPEDELLLCARIRAEAAVGHRAEVERLAWRLTRHARSLGVDLRDDTVMLLQEVMEGRVRARAVS